MQSGIVSLEVKLKPVGQFLFELGIVGIDGCLEFIGNVADVVQQAIVIGLVLLIMVVPMP